MRPNRTKSRGSLPEARLSSRQALDARLEPQPVEIHLQQLGCKVAALDRHALHVRRANGMFVFVGIGEMMVCDPDHECAHLSSIER